MTKVMEGELRYRIPPHLRRRDRHERREDLAQPVLVGHERDSDGNPTLPHGLTLLGVIRNVFVAARCGKE